MADVVQFESKVRRSGAKLDPALKEFIDRAIVPILVKEYLSVAYVENDLAHGDTDAANFICHTATPEGHRP